jgi:MFS family permease
MFNRYWGGRQRYLTLTTAATSLAITVLVYHTHGVPVQAQFLFLVLVGCTVGTIDILLFRNIREPPNLRTDEHAWDTLRQPLRDRNYFKLVRFLCLFHGVSNLAAAFMPLYALDVLRIPLWLAALVWATPSFGYAIVAPLWGRIADRFGHRPILRLCVWLKPGIALVFLLVTPALAAPVLGIALFLDSMLNSGMEIAANSYMLKMAPRENRSMFIAATSALSGLASGAGAILGGLILRHTTAFSVHLAGRDWNHYQLIFFASFLLRVPCIRLAARIREPTSAPSRVVLEYLAGLWPMRPMLLPLDWYRRLRR